MERLAIAAVLAVVALAAAFAARRRRGWDSAAGTMPQSTVPAAVDLALLGIDAGPVIVVFTEETCRTCADAVTVVSGSVGVGVPVVEVPFASERGMHRDHGIDTVPTTVVADAEGQVVDGWIGRVDVSGLTAALARVVGR
ncbi:TlpA family protein disulfide reductase [Candidatus Poriferisodalis sp.]|uniref:TlpA family protein disulfide reductase n=1 Tax=Candidatus Poriferisodalis sp. TaxID=3101277 RepID=UPI003B014F68